MKNLAIAFSIALGIICSAIVYEKTAGISDNTGSDLCKVEKKIVTCDADGRIIKELTLQANDETWVETVKKQITYLGNSVETLLFIKENNEWIVSSREVSSLDADGNLKDKTYYTLNDVGRWKKTYEQSMSDLSLDNDIVEDMVFDVNGNLVMMATYKWEGTEKDGLIKEEYEYVNGSRNKVVSYAWNGESWNKRATANLVIE